MRECFKRKFTIAVDYDTGAVVLISLIAAKKLSTNSHEIFQRRDVSLPFDFGVDPEFRTTIRIQEF